MSSLLTVLSCYECAVMLIQGQAVYRLHYTGYSERMQRWCENEINYQLHEIIVRLKTIINNITIGLYIFVLVD